MQELIDAEFTKNYPDKQLYWIFFVNFFCSVMVNVDHGSLPGCSEEVKKKMNITNIGFGALGTAVYAGLTLGSAMGAKAYQNSKNIKLILASSLAVNGICLIGFTVSNNMSFNLFIRFCTGIFQVFISIFTPVWADSMGSEKLKSLWITILLIASPLGVFIGFTMTSILTSLDGFGWEYSFYFQGLCVIPCCFLIIYADNKFLDIDSANKFRRQCVENIEAMYIDEDKEQEEQKQQEEKKKLEEEKKSIMQNPVMQEFLEMRSQISVRHTRNQGEKIFGKLSARGSVRGGSTIGRLQGKSQKSQTELDVDQSFAQDHESRVSAEGDQSFFDILRTLCQITEFIMLLLAITGFYFVVAGIQYWCPTYMVDVLHINREAATTFFALTCFIAPVSGVVVGGIIISYYGGYNTKKSREIVLIIGWVCLAFTIPIPIVNSFQSFGILVWGLLFFGGSLLPSLTGIMLNSVPEHQRASANSVATLSYNFLGWMPAPFIYGVVSQIVGDPEHREKSRIPMATILYSEFITLTMMTIVILRKLRSETLEHQLSKAEEIFQKQQDDEENQKLLMEEEHEQSGGMLEVNNKEEMIKKVK